MTESPVPSPLAVTRRSLHGIAEWLLSGPQYAQSGTIRLKVVPGGFSTVRDPAVSVVGTRVTGPGGEASIDGSTIRQLGETVGVSPDTPKSIYHDCSEVELDDVLHVDEASASVVMASFALGDAALAEFAPDEKRAVWPEHFDIGINAPSYGANYGVSPGDKYSDEPYAYVGPFDRKQIPHPMFNTFFGAMVLLSELPTAADVAAFFAQGREIVAEFG